MVQPAGLPEVPSVVCMWDGATRVGSHSAGGMVLLDPHRGILLAQGTQYRSIDDPLVVEALALLDATSWLMASWTCDLKAMPRLSLTGSIKRIPRIVRLG
ncbi:unnamed protein product [Linum trigynum]|uniref:RNase H type-1 domain-containing protein n=1 Tax=Linum trigynum TaxID=586398 RepID=A0AAV2DWX6_9ROSI